MTKSIRLSYTLVSIICLILFISVLFANIYPCGYWEQGMLYDDENGYAGHSYESLVHVLGEGFFWEAEEVPIEFEKYDGDGPFYVVGYWWVSALYIPMFIGIIYLGWLIAGGRERISILVPGSEGTQP